MMKAQIKISKVWWNCLIFLLFLGSSYGMIKNAKTGDITESLQAEVVDGTPLTDCVAVEHGLNFTVVLKKDRTVWGWGNNDYGQLGVGITSKTVAAPIETLSGPLGNVTSIFCDELSTTATLNDGTTWKSGDESLLIPWFQRKEQNLVPQLSDKEDSNHIGQSIHNQADNNKNQSLLSAQNTILAEDEAAPWKNAPLDSAPEEPFSVSVVATGPYRAPATVELVASVTHPASTTISKIDFYNGATLLKSVTDFPYEFSYENVTQGNYTITAIATDSEGNTTSATTEFQVVPSNRYNRGFGTNQLYLSSIIALDFEQGIVLDGVSDFSTLYSSTAYPWFLRAASSLKDPCYHINCDTNTTPNMISYIAVDSIPVIDGNPVGNQPPMVAFGSQGGGSPLYINQNYHLGIACGGQDFGSMQGTYFQIEVYNKNDFLNDAFNVSPILQQVYALPKPLNATEWNDFCNNGYVQEYRLNTNVNGGVIDFTTQIQYASIPGVNNSWGQAVSFPLIVTHHATDATYCYKVSFRGVTAVIDSSNNTWSTIPMAKNAAQTGQSCNLSYTLDFDNLSPWSSTLINLPHFQTIPLPSVYEGKSVDDLIHQAPMVHDNLLPPNQGQTEQWTQLNNSPELKTHPLLNQLVNDLGNDPYAIANYVQNEIELTDAVGVNVTDTLDPTSINPQGITRDALATYLEGQGSPIEQCALLIYLLRRIGIPAAYVFPEQNGVRMFDEQMSKILHVQLRGAMNYLGSANIPELIPVNYPWVTAFIDGKWVHLFPWIKDTEVTEGQDLWNFFPQGYATGGEWLLHYLLNDPSIRSLSSEDNVASLFPIYAEEQLSGSNLTLDDVGVQYVNRPHYYSDWNDFPRPWQTPAISSDNLAPHLNASSPDQNPKLIPMLSNLFDTIEVQILRDTNGNGVPDTNNPIIDTGAMRFADLHDRRLLLYHLITEETTPPTYNLILSLEAYDSTEGSGDTTTYAFTDDPGDFRNPQKVSALLRTTSNSGDPSNDKNLFYKISSKHHLAAQDIVFSNETEQTYFNQWPGLVEETSSDDIRPLHKGDMAVLSLEYGRVTEKMRDLELRKYLEYQQKVQADPSISVDPEIATGQMLQIMGKEYYSRVSQFQEAIAALTKTQALSWRAHGLTKLSPERDAHGEPVTNRDHGALDFNLLYPRVDMSFSRAASVANDSVHADLGDIPLEASESVELISGELSAQEHHIINDLFNQTSAISTVKLLDLAEQGPVGVALLTSQNYQEEGSKLYTTTKANGTQSAPHQLSDWLGPQGVNLWSSITAILSQPDYAIYLGNNLGFICNMSLVTHAPITAPGQKGTPYTGMAAFNIGMGTKAGSCAALISDSVTIENGGYGGAVTPISSASPQINNPDFEHWLEENKGVQDWNAINNLLHPSNLNPGSPPPTLTQDQINALQSEVANHGNTGAPSFYGTLRNFVADPVNVVTGEFYINTVDLTLEGPMPLEIRRLYSSQNLSENNIGAGWKLGLFAYLMLSADATDTTPPSLIYAAETDGSVIAYRYNQSQNNWAPQPSDNPNLINENDGIPGPSKNLFNNRITKTTTNGLETYILKGSDGSTRTYVTSSFPILGSPEITRTRPYLSTWQDNQGNSMSFSFGQNNKGNDWGQLNAITSSNGNSIHFSYDHFGHITEAFGSDGRHLTYGYDNNGDLIKVILPDKSVVTYAYEHQNTLASTGTAAASYSTHLLTQENKPGGRILQNSYDDASRMVTSQAATVGISPTPTQTAHFDYNHSSGNSGFISGNSTVTDINGNRTDYLYTQNQLTTTLYPPNSSGMRAGIRQTWNADTKTLASRSDARGLTTSYVYDNQGNLRDKSGSDGYSLNITYNSLNLPTSATDSLGNATLYAYSDSAHPYNLTSITKTSGGATTSSTQLAYQNSGGACGLLSSINANGAVTTYTYSARGFLTSKTEQTGTEDPARTTTISCNPRGEIVSEINSLGEKTIHDYDMMGRPIFEETFDATGSPINWHSAYYNANGEIEWEQGNRFNPVDYIYYSYDRAGHLLHKGTWLSTANPDGSGVSAAGIADTAYTYDGYGNNTSITDPNGHVTSMTYDALGEMITRSSGDGAASEAFTYEPGGLVATHTTVLGGTEQNTYTARGLLESTTHADGTTSSYNYDASGRLVSETLPSGSTWHFSYNGNSITKTFSDCNGSTLASKTETFDGNGNRISWTDNAGNTFQASYDGLSRIKSFQGPPAGDSSATQSETYHYGPNSITTVNAFGESNTTYLDALERPLQTTLHNSDGSITYKKTNWYAPDHQSVMSFEGDGVNVITTTTYTDTLGNPVLIKHGDGSYERYVYDANGNNTSFVDEEGNITSSSYDALNHLSSQTLPGGALIGYSYNAAGELITRSMPEGLTEQNVYNQAGQKISDSLLGSDGSITRNHNYTYSNGLVSSISDPRGFTTSISYDGWGHPANVISRGSGVAEQNQITTCSYDPRGLLTSVSQSYATPSTGPSTGVLRSYDAYGQLTHETTTLNGQKVSEWKQAWNGAARRTSLNWVADNQGTGAQYAFNYNALGLMTAAQNKTGTCSYGYGTDGLLASRNNPFGNTAITRNNRGNITRETLPNSAIESLSWQANNRLASYSIADPSGALVGETRNYGYDSACRLTQEPFTSVTQGTQSANYLFDQNPLLSGKSSTSGLGVRTSETVDGNIINEVSALDLYSRITQSEDENSTTLGSSYDDAGEVTSRRFSSGTAQNLTWDSFGRLVEVDQRDGNDHGFNWVTVYDGLGRRIQTAYSDATGNQTTSAPLNIFYYYDPEVSFLEIGRDYNGRTWDLFGPDRSGFYGGAQGIGGMETTYAENGRETYGILKNFFGDSLGNMNSLGLYAWGNVLGGYGAMPGSSVNEDLVPQWRGHYLDWTGLYYFGARYYDPLEGRFVSPDPLGHDASMSLYDYCNGDPINELDPDGMDAVALGHGWYYFVIRDTSLFDRLGDKNKSIMNSNPLYSEQCATGAQFLAGTFINGKLHDAPSTATWRQGNPVGPNTPPGTMIATGWIDGRYPSAPPSAYAEGGRLAGHTMNHTGIFKGMNPDGTINVFDQFTGKSLGITPYKKAQWNIVTSNQKYDTRASESFVEDQAPEPHSTMKSCGH